MERILQRSLLCPSHTEGHLPLEKGTRETNQYQKLIFWLSIYLLVFNFLKECLEMHRSPFSHPFPSSQEGGWDQVWHPFSPTLGLLHQSQVSLYGNGRDT